MFATPKYLIDELNSLTEDGVNTPKREEGYVTSFSGVIFIFVDMWSSTSNHLTSTVNVIEMKALHQHFQFFCIGLLVDVSFRTISNLRLWVHTVSQ